MRALIVDDSLVARQTALAALEEAFHQLGIDLHIETASSGAEGLKHLASGDIGILVVDLHMPDLHGLEVLRFWAGKHPEGARAMVVSTQVSERDKTAAKETGAHAFLEKPVSRQAFCDALVGFGG
jgi:two-component system chemotaxis response regulator CheY